MESTEELEKLVAGVVSMKIVQRDVLAEGLADWVQKRKMDLLPNTTGMLYGLLRVDPPFGLHMHKGE